MTRIEDPNVHAFPLNGTRIHKQQGYPDSIAVGLEEIGRLPKQQQNAVLRLIEGVVNTARIFGFLNTGDGSLRFTHGDSMVIADVDKKGKIKNYSR